MALVLWWCHYLVEIWHWLLVDITQGDYIPRSIRLAFFDHHRLKNNVVEYEAYITGLETTLNLGVQQLEIHGNSNLVIQQTQGIWRTRGEKLKPYHAYLDLLIDRFDKLRYIHLPRVENQFANALATYLGFCNWDSCRDDYAIIVDWNQIRTSLLLFDWKYWGSGWATMVSWYLSVFGIWCLP